MSGGTGYNGKTTNDAGNVVAVKAAAERESQWGPIDGEVVSYDAETQTAEIRPLYKPIHNGKAIDMPNLLEVPVNWPRSGSSAITQPLPAGSRVRLTPQMRSSENYHVNDNGEPSDTRSFALSDMEASPIGGDSLTSPLQNVDPDNLHIRADETGTFGIKMSPSGKVEITGSHGNVYDLVAQATDLAAQVTQLLATEPALVHTVEYGSIGEQLREIADLLGNMKLSANGSEP